MSASCPTRRRTWRRSYSERFLQCPGRREGRSVDACASSASRAARSCRGVRDPALAIPGQRRMPERRVKMREVGEALFEFNEMSRRALAEPGPTGRPRSKRSSSNSSPISSNGHTSPPWGTAVPGRSPSRASPSRARRRGSGHASSPSAAQRSPSDLACWKAGDDRAVYMSWWKV